MLFFMCRIYYCPECGTRMRVIRLDCKKCGVLFDTDGSQHECQSLSLEDRCKDTKRNARVCGNKAED